MGGHIGLGIGPQVKTASEDDLALLHRAQAGDFSAFESLVERYQGRLHALTWRVATPFAWRLHGSARQNTTLAETSYFICTKAMT